VIDHLQASLQYLADLMNSFKPGSAEARKFQSLSYRFDMTDRSIVFTGDTGPSSDVERLARGADLLISEIGEPEAAAAEVKALRPDLPALTPGVAAPIEGRPAPRPSGRRGWF
jgi:hypothetical protein